ncbi:hypothetical protein COV82_03590 [Candidatus Peregrinibacteria bacterium CG11_big_fil_rev_8_21_14_0_20_46_8]|nr:MAG: hypothetical protein COV82_03590 [Candidatus Peregrinibacteria bacterium CG11_big_fil_rev_8_21_14_0_20_46_8]
MAKLRAPGLGATGAKQLAAGAASLTRRAVQSPALSSQLHDEQFAAFKVDSEKSTLLAQLKKEGDEEHKKAEQEQAQAEFEKQVAQEIDALCEDSRLRVAFVLDYTASTINDVRQFVSDLVRLKAMLDERFASGVDFLPVASRGPAGAPQSLVGQVNDMEFYDDVKNVQYNWPTPIGHGMAEVVNRIFYKEMAPLADVQAIVAISDSSFEIFDTHQSMIDALRNSKVATASLTSAEVPSHVEALKDLGELGCVVDRARPEIDPMKLVFEFIMNTRDAAVRPVAEATVKTRMQKRRPSAQLDGLRLQGGRTFAEHLKLKGHAREAANVIEGGQLKMLTSGR